LSLDHYRKNQEENRKKTAREQFIHQRSRKQKEYNLSLTFKQLLLNAFIHCFYQLNIILEIEETQKKESSIQTVI